MSTTQIDDAGAEHPPAGPEARILSLVSSLTELLFALGLGSQVVGRTMYCVYPKDRVEGVPSVGGTKKVNMEKVSALEPTHAVVNIDETPKELAADLADLGIRVVTTHPIEVADNIPLFELLGSVFGAEARARTLAADFERAYRRVTKRPDRGPDQRVLYLIWKDPWMTVSADTYVSSMLSLIGWRTLGDDKDRRYPEIELSDALLADADLVLLSTEPFAFTEAHVEDFRSAFPADAGKARLVDGQLLSWYGPRAIAGLRYLEDLAEAESS
ncbi:MAG: ABC transporter substrate-binding protein [Proteobacteria bacterium]|nr:ABC transporter substrate-binding protein [Pseudomonadota bacterium]